MSDIRLNKFLGITLSNEKKFVDDKNKARMKSLFAFYCRNMLF